MTTMIDPDAALALAHLPVLMADEREPFEVGAIGWSVYRTHSPSPSSKFELDPQGGTLIEYAIWYDWDIQHLYDLEHVWVRLNAAGDVTGVEASRHGERRDMLAGGQPCRIENGRPVLYLEPGKHAHWTSPEEMQSRRQKILAACSSLAGEHGVHLGNPFARAGAFSATPLDHRLARLKLRGDAFTPSFSFKSVELDPAKLKPWTQLATDIPQRVEALKAHLLAHQPRLAALFVDCGDTLVDERTEVKLDGSEVVVTGELIPGSDLVLAKLKRMGHTLVLVADGPVATFENLLKPRGMWEHFSDHIISERVGVHKPDPAMFRQALAAIGLDESRAAETAMVGNNLSRDILGANRMGIASIFMKWSTLRTHIPESREEVPDFTISFIDDLPDLVDRIDTALALGTRSVT